MQRLASIAILAAVLAPVLAVERPAYAGPNDLVMSRLGIELGEGNSADAIGDSLAFRSLASELGVVLAPRVAAPADTLGFGGFNLSADIAFAGIASDAPYWRVLAGSPDPTGAGGTTHGSGTMSTVGVFVRKGLWLPVPSFEVGAGAVHLRDSHLYAAQGYAKLALHEGYDDLPIPSLAIRGGISRVMGSGELDLTVVSVDGQVSKAFDIRGYVSVEPYAGGSLLIVIPRSEVVDKTPHIAGDRAMNFVFRDQDNIYRTRYFGGLKVKHYVFALLVEAAFATAGTSVDDRLGTDADCAQVGSMTTVCDSTDSASSQSTVTVSLGVDF